jgi:hypothetical protein
MDQFQKYRDMGYSDADIQQAMQEISQEESQGSNLQQSYARTQQMSQNQPVSSNTLIAGQMNQDNLIKWQLELDSILERVEHILRGDKPTMSNGNMIFIPPINDDDKLFNDNGVAEIMRILSMYLNRNTILSNYDEETINWKVLDFGYEVSDLIFLKYEEMGLDTLEKRKRYPMIVRELVDSVHSSFLRALNGGERDSLRQARSINQTEQIMGQGMGMPFNYPQKERSLLNPLRYIKGKYG